MTLPHIVKNGCFSYALCLKLFLVAESLIRPQMTHMPVSLLYFSMNVLVRRKCNKLEIHFSCAHFIAVQVRELHHRGGVLKKKKEKLNYYYYFFTTDVGLI